MKFRQFPDISEFPKIKILPFGVSLKSRESIIFSQEIDVETGESISEEV